MANENMKAKGNEGMASTQVMLRVADILNGRGSINDVEPYLQDQVAHELDMYTNQRKNTVAIVTKGAADVDSTADSKAVAQPDVQPAPQATPQQPKEADGNESATA